MSGVSSRSEWADQGCFQAVIHCRRQGRLWMSMSFRPQKPRVTCVNKPSGDQSKRYVVPVYPVAFKLIRCHCATSGTASATGSAVPAAAGASGYY